MSRKLPSVIVSPTGKSNNTTINLEKDTTMGKPKRKTTSDHQESNRGDDDADHDAVYTYGQPGGSGSSRSNGSGSSGGGGGSGIGGGSGGVAGGSDPPENWREEMRHEIREALAEFLPRTQADIAPGPIEIDEEDVVGADSVPEIMKRLEAGNRSNKMAIRLAGIEKEGNKFQFIDMVEIREKLENADVALKESKKERKNKRNKTKIDRKKERKKERENEMKEGR